MKEKFEDRYNYVKVNGKLVLLDKYPKYDPDASAIRPLHASTKMKKEREER